jgi:hypothetical protein
MPGSNQHGGMPGEGAIVLIGGAHHEVGVGRRVGHRSRVVNFVNNSMDRGDLGPPVGSADDLHHIEVVTDHQTLKVG